MPVDFVSQLYVSAAIRACGLGVVAFAELAAVSYPIVSGSARDMDSRSRRHAAPDSFGDSGAISPVEGAISCTCSYSTACDESNANNSATGCANPCDRRARVRSGQKAHRVSSSEIVTALYLAIATLLLIRMALGSWGLRRMLRSARAVDNPGPGVFESDLLAARSSVGWLRGRKFFSREHGRDWDNTKLQAVLAHEGAHIRRQDWLIRVTAHVNVCIFWFHPMAWWMELSWHGWQREACDDVALARDG